MSIQLHATAAAHEEQAWCIDWSPCGNFLASCSTDLTVKIWQVELHATKRRKAEAAAPNEPAAPEGSGAPREVGAAQNVVELKLVQTLHAVHLRTIRCCAWSPCGTYLATCRCAMHNVDTLLRSQRIVLTVLFICNATIVQF